MPKKTKKQKLRASVHRHAFSPVVVSISSSPLQSPSVTSPLTFTYTSTRTAGSTLIHDERALKSDIIKTMVLVTVILGIELLLSRYLS
ncbi:MAG: hypothetical protein AAB492_04965 [Patescibacteria group bacterium]